MIYGEMLILYMWFTGKFLYNAGDLQGIFDIIQMFYKEMLKLYMWFTGKCLAYQWARIRAPVTAASLAICRQRLHRAIHGAHGILPMQGRGCDQSIGFTVSDAISISWLWSTATRSSPLGYCSILLQVVDNWPHIL